MSTKTVYNILDSDRAFVNPLRANLITLRNLVQSIPAETADTTNYQVSLDNFINHTNLVSGVAEGDKDFRRIISVAANAAVTSKVFATKAIDPEKMIQSLDKGETLIPDHIAYFQNVLNGVAVDETVDDRQSELDNLVSGDEAALASAVAFLSKASFAQTIGPFVTDKNSLDLLKKVGTPEFVAAVEQSTPSYLPYGGDGDSGSGETDTEGNSISDTDFISASRVYVQDYGGYYQSHILESILQEIASAGFKNSGGESSSNDGSIGQNNNYEKEFDDLDEKIKAIVNQQNIFTESITKQGDTIKSVAETQRSQSSSIDVIEKTKTKTYSQDNAPDSDNYNLVIGDVWYDTSNGNQAYRWNGAKWVSVQDQKIDKAYETANNLSDEVSQAVQKAESANAVAQTKTVTFFQNTEPTTDSDGDNAKTGDLWINPDDGNKLKRFNGTDWIDVQDKDIQSALEQAADSQSIADKKIVTYFQDSQPTEDDFPASITSLGVGDLWIDTDDGNHLYRWNGNEWKTSKDTNIADALEKAQNAQATADGKVTTFYSDTQPTDGRDGDLWINTADKNKLYRFNRDEWAVVDNKDIQNALAQAVGAKETADGKIETYYQDDAPTDGSYGDIWFDTNDQNHPYRYDGSGWITIRDKSIGTASQSANDAYQKALDALSAAQSAQATADGAIRTYYQADAPTGLNDSTDIGDLWFNTDTNQASRWSGSEWVLIEDNDIAKALAAAQSAQTTADGKITAYYTDTQPTTADEGDLWYDTSDNNRPYYYDGSKWVDIRDGKIDLKNSTFYQPSAPNVPYLQIGDTWYDTDNGNKLYRYDGSNWIEASDTRISANTDAINTVKTQTTKNADDISTQGERTDSLESSLNVTQGDVQGLSTSKNQTFQQDDSPTANAVGDLWIKTNADNQLYRWNGQAWDEVENKKIQANANAINQTNTKVSDQDDRITANSNTISSNTANIKDKADASALQQTNANVSEQGDKISSQASEINRISASAQYSSKSELGFDTQSPGTIQLADGWKVFASDDTTKNALGYIDPLGNSRAAYGVLNANNISNWSLAKCWRMEGTETVISGSVQVEVNSGASFVVVRFYDINCVRLQINKGEPKNSSGEIDYKFDVPKYAQYYEIILVAGDQGFVDKIPLWFKGFETLQPVPIDYLRMSDPINSRNLTEYS